MISVCLSRISCITVLVLAVTSCAVVTPQDVKPYSTSIAEVLSGKEFLGHPVTDAELPNFDLFAITPEMEAFAKRSVRHSETYFDKIKDLHIALLSAPESGGYGLIYNAYVTEVPITTFEQRRANCLSFTLLYVALARSVGLKAYVNEVEIPPTWDLRNKKDMVFLRHVNVKVPVLGDGANILRHDDVVIDLEMNRYRASYTQHEISDSAVAAQFYSNRAMEYLENNNLVDSFLSLRKSISLNDQQSYVWSNLGALYGRKKLWREAELVYLHGLEIDPEDLTVMNNLSYLYHQTGNKEQAQKFSRLAQRYRESNPFFQYNLALSAFDHGDYDSALAFVLRAMDSEKKDIRFYQLAASIYEKQGRARKLADMQNKIKKLEPEQLVH
jgi:Flp pilus assembly protein TadD